MKKEIKITNFSEVRTLQNIASEYPIDIWVEDAKGSSADAKSLLGMMSLSYDEPISIVVDDKNSEVLDVFMRRLTDASCLEELFKRLNPKLFEKMLDKNK